MAGLSDTINHLLEKLKALEAQNGALAGADSQASQRMGEVENALQAAGQQLQAANAAIQVLTKAVTQLQSPPITQNVVNREEFDSSALESRISELSSQVQGFQTDVVNTAQRAGGEYIRIQNGDYQLRNADGSWSPWKKLWSGQGAGGLGRSQIIDIINEVVSPPDGNSVSVLTDNGDGTYTHDDGNGTEVVIDINAHIPAHSPSVLTDNGDGTYTHDDGSGAQVVIDTNTPIPNLDRFVTFFGDSGQANADDPADAVTFTGINGISVTVSDLGGDAVVAIDGSGIATPPSGVFSPSANKLQGSTNQNLTQGTATVVDFDSEPYNVGSGLSADLPNNEIEVNEAGIYSIKTGILFDGPLIGVLSNVTANIEVDRGSGFAAEFSHEESDSAVGVNDTLTISTGTELELDVGDEVRVTVFYNSTLGGVLQILFATNGQLNFLAMHRVA